MTMLPVMGNPDSMGTRRSSPITRRPHIPRAVPAVITGAPDPTWVRCRAIVLDDRSGRPDANNHLRERGRRKQGDSEQSSHCNLLHSRKLLQHFSPPEYAVVPASSPFQPALNTKVALARQFGSVKFDSQDLFRRRCHLNFLSQSLRSSHTIRTIHIVVRDQADGIRSDCAGKNIAALQARNQF